MNVRLIMTGSEVESRDEDRPLLQTILFENPPGRVVAAVGHYGAPVCDCRLEAVAVEDARRALRPPVGERLFLSPVLVAPNGDPSSADFLTWCAEQRRVFAASLLGVAGAR
jgi:hypothetical protein